MALTHHSSLIMPNFRPDIDNLGHVFFPWWHSWSVDLKYARCWMLDLLEYTPPSTALYTNTSIMKKYPDCMMMGKMIVVKKYLCTWWCKFIIYPSDKKGQGIGQTTSLSSFSFSLFLSCMLKFKLMRRAQSLRATKLLQNKPKNTISFHSI
jgi:hypothetical protein